MNLPILCCPVDRGELVKEENGYVCRSCHRHFREEDGLPDLAYSNLPDVDGHVPYIWSDVFYFENLLKQLVKPNMVIAEVCSGPNIIVPLLLARLNVPVTYYSIGINGVHLKQQQGGVKFPIHSVIGDATALPLQDDSIDLYIGHHAINDVWLSKGNVGVAASYDEMHRVTKPDGVIIHSDCVLQHDSRVGDPSTKVIGLPSLTQFLTEKGYRHVQENGGEMDWVIASLEQEISLNEPEDYVIRVGV